MATALRSTIQSLDQQATQPIAAFQIGIDDFEPDFIDPGAAQQNMGPDFGAHANVDFQIGFAADREVCPPWSPFRRQGSTRVSESSICPRNYRSCRLQSSASTSRSYRRWRTQGHAGAISSGAIANSPGSRPLSDIT